MTVETFQPAGALVAPSSSGAAVDSIVRWASNLSTAAQAIRMIVDTPFMPASFWPSPRVNGQLVGLRDWPTPHLQHPRESDQDYAARREICISSGSIAVVKGDEVGLTPQAALESIYVVRGKPGMYAETMEALARSHGHEVVLVELTDRLCRMRGRHHDSDAWQQFEFTMERARRAGYTKQNQKYDNDPQTMLHARCRSITVRGTCPEVLKGLRSVEEITDDGDGEAPRPATRTVQRAPAARALPAASTAPAPAAQAPTAAPAAAQEPSGPPLPGEDEQPAVVPLAPAAAQAIDPRQWRAINERFVELAAAVPRAGLTGPGQSERRTYVISTIVDRPITRGSELLAIDAALVLDNLAGDGGVALVTDLLTDAQVVREEYGDQAPTHVVATGPALPGEADPYADLDPTVEAGFATDEAAS